MKILYHHRTQGRGGEGVHIREIVKAMEGLGHNVIIVSPPGIDVYEDYKKDTAATTSRSMLSKIWLWVSKHTPQVVFELMEICYNAVAANKISNILKKEKIDFIYERYAFFSWAGISMAKRYNVPLILEVNEISGIKRQRGQIIVGLANKIEADIFKKADSIVTVSSFLKNEIVRRCAEADKVHLVPNAVDMTRFDTHVSGVKVRESMGLNGKTILGFVGHFVKWDRLDKLVEIFAEIAMGHPGASLLLVGDARNRDDRRELDQLIGDKGLCKRAYITGRVSIDEIPQYIAAMDICIIPHSNLFGSPLVAFEYMAMAKAIVAPRIAPIEDVITDGVNGALFDMGNDQSLKECIVGLLDNQEKRQRLGEAARSAVLTRHTWTKNARKILSIAESLDHRPHIRDQRQ